LKYEEYNIGEGTLNFTVVEPNGFNPHNHYPIVVLMHGFGASSKDLAPLASAINARGYIYAFPQAPIEMRMGFGGIGYAWAPISGDGIEESINNSKSLINRFLDELLELYGDEDTKVVLGGFSQGAMMALEVGLESPGRITGILSCSGWLNSSQLDTEPESNNQQQLFIGHGSLDDIVPIQKSIEAVGKLSAKGYLTEFHEYDIAHEISHVEISDISEWIQSVIPPLDI
tara:strand:- start:1867 stop:2553 length:687 start_codon:yes stop_codon:yes gene_type:complete